MATDTRRRVKLYALNAERQWDDRGTGHVSSNYVERLKGISLLVRAESDGSLLLESKIQPDTAYQKQQDTLIVWSEGDNFDLALSFQEKAGCDEIWEKICQVQGKDPSVEITQDIVEESEDERFEEMSDSAPPIELPPCELQRLEDISETIQSCITTPLRKEKLAMALENENYIKKLLNLFHVCEDLENTEGLHHLFEIFKNIFLLNKNALFEIMFADDTIFDVVGCLEYDPSASQPKRHRQYLKQWAKFREAVPIKNQDLLAKIHQTFRVQYIQDIILPAPSVFCEDNMLNTLSSFIFFNKVEIVTLIQEDERFLLDVFTLLTDPTTTDAKRRDIVLFLKEFCNYAQNLQPQGKDSFYKTLTCLGILQALEITLVMNDQKTKAASIDILTAIVEFSPLVVRNYTLQQVGRNDGEKMLINIAIEQMLTDSEPELGVAVQLMGIIKTLLEPDNMLTEKGDFLNFFYKHSIQTLISPLLLNTVGDRPQNEDYQTAQLLGIVLDILSFCVEHHTYHIKNFIIQKDLLKRILVLMKSSHTFLVLGALRLLRKIVALKDEFYNRHIVKSNLFAPVVDAFIRNNGRYNLLESAILELFEFIKLEDIRSLCLYFVEHFSKIFDDIEYVQTFKYLKNRYDQCQDRLKDRDRNSIDSQLPIIRTNTGRFRRDQRQMEEEEEMWFNEDEDFADELETYNSVMKPVTEKNSLLSHQQKSPPQSTTHNSNANANSNTNSNTTTSNLHAISNGGLSNSSNCNSSLTVATTPATTTTSPTLTGSSSLSLSPNGASDGGDSSNSPTHSSNGDSSNESNHLCDQHEEDEEMDQQEGQVDIQNNVSPTSHLEVAAAAAAVAFQQQQQQQQQEQQQQQQQNSLQNYQHQQHIKHLTRTLAAVAAVAAANGVTNSTAAATAVAVAAAASSSPLAASSEPSSSSSLSSSSSPTSSSSSPTQENQSDSSNLSNNAESSDTTTETTTTTAAASSSLTTSKGNDDNETETEMDIETETVTQDGNANAEASEQKQNTNPEPAANLIELQQQLAAVEGMQQTAENEEEEESVVVASSIAESAAVAVAATASQLLTIATAMAASCGAAAAAAAVNSSVLASTQANLIANESSSATNFNNEETSSLSSSSSSLSNKSSNGDSSSDSSSCTNHITGGNNSTPEDDSQQHEDQVKSANAEESLAVKSVECNGPTTAVTITANTTPIIANENTLKKGLVDYESDSPEEDFVEEDLDEGPSEKKARLA